MVLARQIGATLICDELPVNARVTNHHFEPLLECAAGDLSVLQIGVLREGYSIRQRPRVTLARDGTELISGGQAFLV